MGHIKHKLKTFGSHFERWALPTASLYLSIFSAIILLLHLKPWVFLRPIDNFWPFHSCLGAISLLRDYNTRLLNRQCDSYHLENLEMTERSKIALWKRIQKLVRGPKDDAQLFMEAHFITKFSIRLSAWLRCLWSIHQHYSLKIQSDSYLSSDQS